MKDRNGIEFEAGCLVKMYRTLRDLTRTVGVDEFGRVTEIYTNGIVVDFPNGSIFLYDPGNYVIVITEPNIAKFTLNEPVALLVDKFAYNSSMLLRRDCIGRVSFIYKDNTYMVDFADNGYLYYVICDHTEIKALK